MKKLQSLLLVAITIFFDNYFSTVKLFDELLENGVYACGTYRKDRKNIPKKIKQVKMGKYALYIVCMKVNWIRGRFCHLHYNSTLTTEILVYTFR